MAFWSAISLTFSAIPKVHSELGQVFKLRRGTREGCFDVAKHGLSTSISVTFQATLNLSAHFITHYPRICVNFWVILGHFGKEIIFLKGWVKLRKFEVLKILKNWNWKWRISRWTPMLRQRPQNQKDSHDFFVISVILLKWANTRDFRLSFFQIVGELRGFTAVTKLISNLKSLYDVGDAVSTLETLFVMDFEACQSRSITWSLFTLKASKLVNWLLSTWSFMWWCLFIDWFKFETHPQLTAQFRNGLYPYQSGALRSSFYLNPRRKLHSALLHAKYQIEGNDVGFSGLELFLTKDCSNNDPV